MVMIHSGDPCAPVPAAGAEAPRDPRPAAPRAGKSKTTRLSSEARERATQRRDEDRGNAIRRVVPSDPWYWECQGAFERKLAKAGAADPVAELARRGVFPPGPGRANGSSPVATPMVACESRACTHRHGRGRELKEVHKRYPFYAATWQQRSVSDVEVVGIDRATGQARSIRLKAVDRREAFRLAKAQGVEPTFVKVTRAGRKLTLCYECALALLMAKRAREAARESRATGETPVRDASGKIVVEMKSDETPHQAAMSALRRYRVKVDEPKLEPEDEASLRTEVAGYLAAVEPAAVVTLNFGFEAGPSRRKAQGQ